MLKPFIPKDRRPNPFVLKDLRPPAAATAAKSLI